MVIEIISVGTELLLGDIVNTNAQYLSRRLADMGFYCYRQTVVGDNPERLRKAIESAFNYADMVITTGGLGPTEDDLTKEVAAEYFHLPLQFDPDSWDHIVQRFAHRKLPIPVSNKKQAFFPSGCVIMPNPNGTAPGAIFGNQKKTIAVLPGPPKEMIPMFENSVVPFLSVKQDGVIVSRVLRTIGIGESAVEEILLPIIDRQTNPTVATYASSYEVILRITATGKSSAEANALISETEKEVRFLLGDKVYGTDNQTIEEIVIAHLLEINKTVALIENYTAGLCFASLSEIEGALRVLKAGWAFIDKSVLPDIFGDLEGQSPETDNKSSIFADYARKKARADIGLSIIQDASGEAIITIRSEDKSIVKQYHFSSDTHTARQRVARAAFDCLRTW